jgi:hypothetical protein
MNYLRAQRANLLFFRDAQKQKQQQQQQVKEEPELDQWMEQDLELTTPSEACPSEFNPPSLVVADQVKEFELVQQRRITVFKMDWLPCNIWTSKQ